MSRLIFFCLYFILNEGVFAQDSLKMRHKSLSHPDSANHYLKFRQYLNSKPTKHFKDSLSRINYNNKLKTILATNSSFNNLSKKPVFKINSGNINYGYFFRSNSDTPFIERNIFQHQFVGGINLSIAQKYPFSILFQVRRSNSIFLQNINDVQVSFDIQEYRRIVSSKVSNSLVNISNGIKDSLLDKTIVLKQIELHNLTTNIPDKLSIQEVVEAKELLNVPEMAYDKNLPDSVARVKKDSILKNAEAILKTYEVYRSNILRESQYIDSLKRIQQNLKNEQDKIIKLSKLKFSNYNDYEFLRNDTVLAKYKSRLFSIRNRGVMAIRQFKLGRSPLNYSELTTNNISLNGLNFEYNSWYYFALAIGMIDFRFRDFAINSINRPKQYLGMIRLGIGNLESNNIILTAFKGRKQVFANGSINGNYSFITTGLSIETRVKINKWSFIRIEGAQSVAPDFRFAPAKNNTFNFTDKNDKAFSFFGQFELPKFKSKTSVKYKFVGSNFQSFSSFQTNAEQVSWSIRTDKYLLKKHLKISAQLRKNDFSNPYLILPYQSSTVFKSATITFRKRKLPSFTIGFTPMTQLSNIGNSIVENTFNSLIITGNHLFKVKGVYANSTFMFNRFYNTGRDSGFIYFNAMNCFLNQQFITDSYIGQLGLTYSNNGSFRYLVVEEQLKLLPKRSIIKHFLFGTKFYQINKKYAAFGFSAGTAIQILNNYDFSFFYERGYIPGSLGNIVNNTVANVQLTKRF